ncbi:unnamed protein product [Hydatigera taeniaeformis]|uniref:Uncharacterized protein n=1 Tax=Hydatigena taeniaeformis TaxID=6205 RepID=A0A0R3WX79_HYDTA|nr:unnamed protein product [Hydatigera taeniaeformis]
MMKENRSRMHQRSFSAQTCDTIFKPCEYISILTSTSATPVNKTPNYQQPGQAYLTTNTYPTPNGNIRVVERRTRLKQEEREPRSSSVPVYKFTRDKAEGEEVRDTIIPSMDDSPTSVLRGVAPWMAAEERAAVIKKDRRNRMKQNVHTIRDHMLSSWGQVNFDGKPPRHPSATHVYPSPELW